MWCDCPEAIAMRQVDSKRTTLKPSFSLYTLGSTPIPWVQLPYLGFNPHTLGSTPIPWVQLGLPYLQIQKRGHFGREGGGVSYFTSELFVWMENH